MSTFTELVGQKIQGMTLSDNGKILTIKTEEFKFTYDAVGDCCADAYVAEVNWSELSDILGQEIVNIAANGHTTNDEYGNQVDTEFYSIETHKGDMHFELRTEHNGYYCGWLTLRSKESIWPVFDDIREEASLSD